MLSPQAASVWKRAVSATDGHQTLVMKINTEGKVYKVALDQDRARQDSKGGSVSYLNNTVMLKGRKVQGKKSAARGLISSMASQAGIPVEPTFASWSLGKNFVEQMSETGMTARISGKVRIAGNQNTILELKGPNRKVSILVRDKDGLPVRITARYRDRNNRKIHESDKQITYLSVGKSLPDRFFTLK